MAHLRGCERDLYGGNVTLQLYNSIIFIKAGPKPVRNFNTCEGFLGGYSHKIGFVVTLLISIPFRTEKIEQGKFDRKGNGRAENLQLR